MAKERPARVSPLRASDDPQRVSAFPVHGAAQLPSVRVNSYNIDVEYEGKRLARCTNKRALKMMVDKWRKLARPPGADPWQGRPALSITKNEMDGALAGRDYAARAVVHAAIEDFSCALALLVQRFLTVPEWQLVRRIVVGGGLRGSETGELIIQRAQARLNQSGIRIRLCPIRSHPHDAALLGAMHLVPAWMLTGHDAIVAADIGGTNVRVGLVRLNLGRKGSLSKAKVVKRFLWRHVDDGADRDALTGWIIERMRRLIKRASAEGIRVAPYVGVGCPGFIAADGSIGAGSYVLPGNWRSARFNLPSLIAESLPKIDGQRPVVLLHNDAVMQGLSEVPFVDGGARYGVFTVGTGLGNAAFSIIR